MKKYNITALIILLLTISISAQTFVAKGDSRNQATFESNAPLEDIVGVSSELVAKAEVNPSDISNASGSVMVDLRKLKTGINLRDEHLRSEMWLNTEEYPYAEFALNKITGAESLPEGKEVNVKFHGTFTVHGVSKELVADGTLTYIKESEKTKANIKGNLLKVQAAFTIQLANYGVIIPDMMIGKVDDTIKVSTLFIATDSPE